MNAIKRFRAIASLIILIGLIFTGCGNLLTVAPAIGQNDVILDRGGDNLPGVVDEYGMLQVKNGKLSSSEANGGDPIQLKGMSLFWSMWGQAWWNESAIDQAVDYLGCEIIRAPLGIGDAPNPIKVGGYLSGDVNKAINKARVETVVNEAIYKGIYVIIDWHDSWAETHLEAAKEYFSEMAQKYKDVPNVMFEIYNEPYNQGWPTIKTYAEEVIKVIRDAGANNVIIVGTPFYSQLGGVKDNPIRDASNALAANVAYTLHFYAAFGPHYFNGGTSGLGKTAVDTVNAGLCVVVTEWGTCMNTGAEPVDSVQSQEWVDWMDANKITWCNWSLNDSKEAASIFRVNANPYGPWNVSDITESGRYLINGIAGKEPPLPGPKTPFVVSPSLIRLKGNGSEGKSTSIIKGSISGAVSDQVWLHVQISGQTINVKADVNNSTTTDRTGTISLTDGNGNKAKVKVIQLRNDGNMALMQPTYASSQEGSYRASNATDGDETNTRWGSLFTENKRIPDEDFNWILIDLGKNRSFGKIDLIWEAAYASSYVIEKAQDQGSDDIPADSQFYDVYRSGDIAGGLGGHTDSLDTDDLGGMSTARWIRVRSFGRTYIGNNQYGVSLYEVKIFKVPGIGVWGGDSPMFAGAYSQGLETWSNIAWTATSNADWLSVNPSTGGSNEDPPSYQHPNIEYAANLTGQERTGIITFSGGGAPSKTLSITQPAETREYHTYDKDKNPVVMYLKPEITSQVVNGDGSMDVAIKVNTNWTWSTTLVGSPSWLTMAPVPFINDGIARLHAEPNATGSERTALVVFDNGPFPCLAYVWITQAPMAQQFKMTIAGGGEQQFMTITDAGAWTVTNSAPSWLSMAPTGGYGVGTISVVAGVNNTGATRTATIAITQNGATKTILVTQDPVSLVASPAVISIEANGGTESFTISSNTRWWSAYTTDGGGWLSINTGSYSGSGNGTVFFTLSKNTTGKVRTATITIIGGDVPNQIVTITQAK